MKLIVAVLMLSSAAVVAQTNSVEPKSAGGHPKPMTDAAIVQMVKAGVSQDLIILAISECEAHFVIDNGSVTYMTQNGVPADVLKAMTAKQKGDPIPGFAQDVKLPSPPTVDPETFKKVVYSYRDKPRDKDLTSASGSLTFETGKITFSGRSTTNMDYLPDGATGGKNVYGDGYIVHNAVAFEIGVSQITGVLYERTAHPRYAAAFLLAWPLIFTKEKQHFLTVQYRTESGEAKYAMFRLDKENYRAILAAVEATVGKKIERSDES